MTPFQDYYIPDIEERLGRELTGEERVFAMKCYVQGWHPARTVEAIKNDCKE